MTDTHGITIKTNARDARLLSAIVSPTRDFLPTGERGVYFMADPDECRALRDAEMLAERGVTVLAVV